MAQVQTGTQVKTSDQFDILLVGGGIVGMTAALGFAKSGFTVAVIDQAAPNAMMDDPFDGRASAIAYSSSRLLDALGLMTDLAPLSQPILEIRVSDGPSLMHLHFDHQSLSAGTTGPLGYLMENRHIRRATFKAARTLDGLTVIAPDGVKAIERSAGAVHLHLTSGRQLEGRLMLGCDGRGSFVRREAGIGVTGWSYKQVGIVAALSHEESHAGIAHERFLPAGPFALLPLTGNRSSLVWTEKDHLAQTIMALPKPAFEAEIQERAGDFLGKISQIGDLRWSYPLSAQFAERYTAPRTALIGDAAHGIHPIAGQGLNLGLRDVAALLDVVREARDVGLDIGAPDVLGRYEEWRRFDNMTLVGVTDILNRLFSNAITPLRLARDVGMAAIDKIPTAKNFFMSHARGTVGTLPSTLRGETL